MNKKIRFVLLIMTIVYMLFIPLDVFAGNNDSLPSYGFVGEGDELWKYNRLHSALRISIYWAPSHSDFELGTDGVIQVGDTVDVSKTGPWYKVESYTKRTIYWYMNNDRKGNGMSYRKKDSSVSEPYYWAGPEEIFNSLGQDIVELMPDVWDGTKEEWDNWFEGPIINGEKMYRNIPEIARLCNASISSENFKNGIYSERNYESQTGVYKIFFEPVIYPIVDGVPMAMTLRDIIRWEEGFCNGEISTTDSKDLIQWITPVFVFTANSQFLIENEPAICMYGKSSKHYNEAYLENIEPLFKQNAALADTYQVFYGSPYIDVRRQQREEIKEQLEPNGGIIYNSMGVGVITTEGNKEPISQEENIETGEQNSPLSRFEGVINAAPRDNESFEVTEGIPSGEDVYVQIVADNYVYHLVTNHVTGYAPTVVEVDYINASDYPITTTIVVNKPYSYYEIKSFELYSIKEAMVENHVLPGEKILITPSAEYKPPEVEITHQEDDQFTYHIAGYTPSLRMSSGGSNYAEVRKDVEAAVGDPVIKSDKLIIDGKIIIDPEEGFIPDVKPEKTDRDILYVSDLKIDEEIINGLYQSKGILTYQKTYAYNPENPDDTLVFDIEDINPVRVHTPVCSDLSVSSDDKYNQHPSPAQGTSSLILGRPFTIEIKNEGTHKDVKGYGTKDYSKYIKDREVRFGFDTYLGTDRSGTYLKADTWHSLKDLGIDTSESSITFYTPAWVDTGIYNVEFRNLALNNPTNGTSELNANLDLANSMARSEKAVEVSGRIYDLAITDIDDIGWETFFRTEKGSSNSTGKAFYVGPTDINGNLNGDHKYFLPVLPNKNDVPGYQNRAVKLGYAFKFEVKTIGNFYNYEDYLRIEPVFAFVDKEGKNRQEVDLYYTTPQSALIKVGSPQDTLTMSIVLDYKYRGINLSEFENAAGALYRLREGIKDYTQDKWVETFPRLSQIGVPTYKYTEITLTEPLRSFIGPKNNIPTGVSIDKAFASAQKWYGEYSLPADCLIVKKGTDLSGEKNLTRNSPIFLKEGYLLVNFKNISVGKNNEFDNPYVKYTGKTGDGWALESYDTNQGGWQLIDGDVLAYYGDKRSTDDYTGTGTH